MRVVCFANIRQDSEAILEQHGGLISSTRQMDAMLNDDDDVERFAKIFMNGEDTLPCKPESKHWNFEGAKAAKEIL